LIGFADFADGYYTTIDHQKVQDSNLDHALATIDPIDEVKTVLHVSIGKYSLKSRSESQLVFSEEGWG
jgi:hypothetical protein